jgi:cell cycle arrest protein BUB2
VGKRIVAADAIHLDRLIRDGPPDGDLAGALENTRLKILDQGVKSDTDGMVHVQLSNSNNTTLMTCSLLFEYIFGLYY